MYRSCPGCKKKIYFDFVLTCENYDKRDEKGISSSTVAKFKCPMCSRTLTLMIDTASKQMYNECISEKYDDYEGFLDAKFAAVPRPEKTDPDIEYDYPDELVFSENVFCFTGRFENPEMTRKKLTLACEYRGSVTNFL